MGPTTLCRRCCRHLVGEGSIVLRVQWTVYKVDHQKARREVPLRSDQLLGPLKSYRTTGLHCRELGASRGMSDVSEPTVAVNVVQMPVV